MKELKELGAAIVATLIVLLLSAEYWSPLLPERFTVRYLLIAATVLAILLGAIIALDAVIVGNAPMTIIGAKQRGETARMKHAYPRR